MRHGLLENCSVRWVAPCVLLVSCQYLQQEQEAPEKGEPWSTAYGGNGPRPRPIPECTNDFECEIGAICSVGQCLFPEPGAGGSGGGAPSVPCADLGPPRTGTSRAYALPAGVSRVGCGYGVSASEPLAVDHVAGFGLYYATLAEADFGAAEACGTCIEVVSPAGFAVTATIIDQCPECAPGDVGLSATALTDLGGAGTVTWRTVACPEELAITFRLEDPSANQGAVLVQGHRYPLRAVEANLASGWAPATRRPDNYWLLPLGALLNSQYALRVRDANGSEREASLLLVPEDQFAAEQFPLCQ